MFALSVLLFVGRQRSSGSEYEYLPACERQTAERGAQPNRNGRRLYFSVQGQDDGS